MELPVPLGVPDRFDGQGRPLRLDEESREAWADCLAAWARERGAQLDEDGE